ncbi:regulatory protein RecX [Algoriphagus namhaensis]
MWRKNYSNEPPKKTWSPEQAKEKMMAYCAYQERCIWEAKRKMNEKNLDPDTQQEVLQYLLAEKFIDEARYARAFARGKFNLKKWGRNRIRMELKMRQIAEPLIQAGLSEIDPIAYYDTLCLQVELRWEREKEKEPFKKRFKVVGYLMQKGFEKDLIEEAIEDLSK